MRSIGFRVKPGSIAFVVLEGTRTHPVQIAGEERKLPKTGGWSTRLGWVRKEVQEVVHQFSPDTAAFRAREATAKATGKSAEHRMQIEGVLQEAIFSSDQELESIPLVASQIKKALGFSGKAADVASFLNGFPSMGAMNTGKLREACIPAMAALDDS